MVRSSIGALSTRLDPGRAAVGFVLSYVVVAFLAFGLYLLIAGVTTGISTANQFSVREDSAYALSEKLYPLLNLAVWTVFAGLYFRRPRTARRSREALTLGVAWLLVVLPVDLVAFVLIKNPMSLSAYDFYVGQFPWIYLTYAAVLLSPLCFVTLSKLVGGGLRRRTSPTGTAGLG